MSLGLILDVIVVVSMLLAFAGLMRTQRMLKAVREASRDFSRYVDTMNAAILRAQEVLGDLKEVASERGQRLQERINKAQSLSDELDFMLQSGNKLADRLESGIRGGQKSISQTPSQADITTSEEHLDVASPHKPRKSAKSKTEEKLKAALDKKRVAAKGSL